MATVFYRRVSTPEQNIQNQTPPAGTDKVFEDHAAGSLADRPGLLACLAYLREGDTLITVAIDRLARNVEHLLSTVRSLNAKGVTVVFQREGMVFPPNSSNPTSKLMLTVIGAVAALERELLKERQIAGIARAKAAGKYKGRKHALSGGRAAEFVAEARSLKRGESLAALARRYKISRQTAYDYLERAKP